MKFLNFVNNIMLWTNNNIIRPIFGNMIIFDLIIFIVFIALIVTIILLLLRIKAINMSNKMNELSIQELLSTIAEKNNEIEALKTKKRKVNNKKN